MVQIKTEETPDEPSLNIAPPFPSRPLPHEVIERIFELTYDSLYSTVADPAARATPESAPFVFTNFSRVNRAWKDAAAPYLLRFVNWSSIAYSLQALKNGADPALVREVEVNPKMDPVIYWEGAARGPAPVEMEQFQKHVAQTAWPSFLERTLPTLGRLELKTWTSSWWWTSAADEEAPGPALLRLIGSVPGALASLRSLKLDLPMGSSLDILLPLISAARHLQHLSLKSSHVLDAPEELVSPLPAHQILSSLRIVDINIYSSAACLSTFLFPFLLVPSSDTIENLSLSAFKSEQSSNTYSPDSFSDFFARPFPSLRHLSFNGPFFPTPSSADVARTFPTLETLSFLPRKTLSRSTFPYPTPPMRELALFGLDTDDLAFIFSLLHTPSTAARLAELQVLDLEFAEPNFDEETREQLEMVIERCEALGIRLLGCFLSDLVDSEYSAGESDDGSSEDSEVDSEGNEWDDEDEQFAGGNWSEARRQEKELDQALQAFLPLQRHFPDHRSYEAAVESAREAFKPYMGRRSEEE